MTTTAVNAGSRRLLGLEWINVIGMAARPLLLKLNPLRDKLSIFSMSYCVHAVNK